MCGGSVTTLALLLRSEFAVSASGCRAERDLEHAQAPTRGSKCVLVQLSPEFCWRTEVCMPTSDASRRTQQILPGEYAARLVVWCRIAQGCDTMRNVYCCNSQRKFLRAKHRALESFYFSLRPVLSFNPRCLVLIQRFIEYFPSVITGFAEIVLERPN